MKVVTLSYAPEKKWSDSFPPLDSDRTLVAVFGDSKYLDDPGPIRELAAAYPQSHIVGCSSAGEILGTEIFDGTLSVAVVQFDKASIETAFAPLTAPANSRAAGELLGKQLFRPDLRAILVLAEGIHVNGSELVLGLNSVLPESVLVTGGLAGDGDRFKRTWIIADGAPSDGGVSAAGFYGDSIRVGHGSKGGWDMFGPERIVTRSEGNVLYELDGKPALDLYKQYLGTRASGLPATGLLFPLALREKAADERQLVRTILAVDDQQKSMTFAGDVPQGSLAQFMKANFDRLVEGAGDAALMTKERIRGGTEFLSIAISCVGRRLILGDRAEEETEATMERFPPSTKQVGFYSYGEISPYATGYCDLHNQTMTLTLISEA